MAPDLSSAGLRYNPAYLFEFLQRPTKVRQYLGRARMPDFHFSPPEALALAAFLQTQQTIPGSWPELPSSVERVAARDPVPLSPAQLSTVKTESLICLTCHTLEGKGGHRAVEWADIGFRLQPQWIRQYLVEPSMFGVHPTNMPALFYRLSPDGRSFQELVPEAPEKISLLADYFFSLNSEKREVLEKEYRVAKANFPKATATLGEAIFRAQNCAACHRHVSIAPRSSSAPDLMRESVRVTPGWLRNYLRHPTPIRPFGFSPGDGARMPDFALSGAEVEEVLGIFSMASNPHPQKSDFQARKLSVFSRKKARLLLTEKLSCLGCHRLGAQGGRIGPDLTEVRARLRPDYVYGMITNPRTLNPRTIMPQAPLSAETAELLASFLFQEDEPLQREAYASLLGFSIMPEPVSAVSEADAAVPEARNRYFKCCAPCHGIEGRGDGFNARFLQQTPAIHADSISMSRRADDTLYDGIASGGAMLDRSHLMPPWGATFSRAEITGLVGYIRTLCRCQGPAWSLDNVTGR